MGGVGVTPPFRSHWTNVNQTEAPKSADEPTNTHCKMLTPYGIFPARDPLPIGSGSKSRAAAIANASETVSHFVLRR